jgi:integrase
MLQITEGKSKAARRVLPLTPAAANALHNRWIAYASPREGWVFPSTSPSGHLENHSTKNCHARAMTALKGKVKPFPPYIMRHTALTNLAALGVDAFTLKQIAGHSNISITQRYCHLQREAVENAFGQLAASHSGEELLHFLLQSENAPPGPQLQSGAKSLN